ncbi:hypothetical protein [Acinetobacter pittii]|uniref:hypothetical protein n=1 Tax=Acinetobacter pittii TaxID=48296 RepID=UPI002AFE8465|nr:hypothetical protein [Acinetobacter pittii]
MTTKTVKKTPPSMTIPEDRSSRALSFVKEDPQAVIPENPKKSDELDGRYKSLKRYMEEFGITDVSSIDIKRLNCDIPKDLHLWLNIYAKGDDNYGSMTNIIVELLGKFAKERGFTPKKK